MRYRTIVADPPWDYGGAPMAVNVANRNRREVLPYPAMSVDEIAGLPVAEWADDDSRLFLWATNTHLPDAFGVVQAWGFRYRQTLVWHKTRSTPQGSVAPNRAEFLLVARRGSPATGTRLPSAVIVAPPRGHSEKPECFMDYIEAVSPAPYLEMFSRRARMGWDTWGNEALEHVSLEAGTP